ncbi:MULTISPECIES: LOG family protein [unclassified Arthrobacter]|uniref:LOG family protein n=1 Tax=unclassified Arthrobacter TaxID=235627 RepID=UPI002DF7FCF1|nr:MULTISPECIES: Rossmann fold nucleotide-binding protein [unclassified Arthrobacter]MEC5192100.1 putative Rossmann-fold nucleotide-binding protein [Arthrobacter sp. MP_M4]MEC5203613.1 putative Rossmann-fold nucleotide-binding protein [Arthrobacter sp. MP_M7]
MSAARSLHASPRTLEVESLDSFDRLVAGGATSLQGWHVQSLDLRGRAAQLRAVHPQGGIFLGCTFDGGVEESLRSRGALIFPKLDAVPFNPYRGQLYTPQELYEGISDSRYEDTPDAKVYQWSIRPGQRHRLDATLAAALHDHAIGDALEELTRSELCTGRTMVGVMGGHAATRGSAVYDQAALLGRLLARDGRVVATGGGPGAMEAANLGAYLSNAAEPDVRQALADLAAVPGFRPSVSAWARAAAAVVERHPEGTPSLGIPTWFYGHEPPNFFATHIAKYFANSIREAILLELCTGGIVFLPGSGGTVQEIFQDACENYYGAPETITPMVLVGQEHWLRRYPAWPLLQSLAAGRGMENRIFLVDTVEQALAVLDG